MELTNERKNYNTFDVAKFICSILVVMIHVPPFGNQTDSNVFYYLNFLLCQCLCRVAVPLFFIFNGFFLYKKISLENFSFGSIKKYFIHILKLYLLWSLIYFPLILLSIVNNHPKGIIYEIIMYLKNVILREGYTHLWYLHALLCAVALISFLLYKKWSPQKILILSSVCYILGLLGNGYYGLISPLFKIPLLGKIIVLYFKIFNTTRNGLFFAFFFVTIGLFLSQKELLISRKKSLFFFIISLFMLCIEGFLIDYFNIAKEHSILLFTIPSAFFCFSYLKTINLKESKLYIYLRKLSSLIFYGHLWVSNAILLLSKLLAVNIQSTPLRFILVLSLTIFISIVVIKISKIKQFSWLRIFY